jgi:hypothetical protein
VQAYGAGAQSGGGCVGGKGGQAQAVLQVLSIDMYIIFFLLFIKFKHCIYCFPS